MNRGIWSLLVVCCAGGCGGEAVQAREPEAPATPTMELPSAATATYAQLPPAPVLLHAAQRSDLCVDANRRGQIHLFKCHGRPNQRWTFVGQRDGTVQLVGQGGNCIGGNAPGNQLDLWPCAGPVSRYRFDGGRLMELVTNACVTATDLQSGGRILLDTCVPANAGQVWTVGPVTAPSAEDAATLGRVREETSWNKARVTGCELPVSLTGCDAVRIYLATYPTGAHVDEARRALATGEPQLEKLQRDENAWQQAGLAACRARAAKDACDGVDLYLVKFPAGTHADEARQLVAKP